MPDLKLKLEKGDLTTCLGQLIPVDTVPTFTVTPSPTKENPIKHTVKIEFDITPEQVYDPRQPEIKEGDSFAVVNSLSDSNKEMEDMRLAFTVLKGVGSDFTLKVNLSGVIPGEKGKHGS